MRRKGTPKPRLSEAVAAEALERSGGFCACGCGRYASEWHHCFPQAKWSELADVADNIVAVAKHCHGQHTSAFKRFPRSICAHAERLATTPQMRSYLDRVYGVGSVS